MAGISAMLRELVETYQVIKGTSICFPRPAKWWANVPDAAARFAEMQKGFFCQNEGCKFAIGKTASGGK